LGVEYVCVANTQISFLEMVATLVVIFFFFLGLLFAIDGV